MKILFSQTYFLPYVSGLTIYAQRITEGLANKGHQVEILVSGHAKSLKPTEADGNLTITRVPYLFKLHKGFFSPKWPLISLTKAYSSDVVICNLPQVEAFWLLLFARLFKKRSVVIYTCEVKLSGGLISRLIEEALYWSNWLSCFLADKIVCYTQDYAKSTKLLQNFTSKQVYILPPILISKEDKRLTAKIKKQINRRPSEFILGFAARLSAEKGLEYLLEAIPLIERSGLKVKVVCAGPMQEVVGEAAYFAKITRLTKDLKDKILFLGSLDFQAMRSFYKNIDVLVLPSLNSTEAFGIVQGEAMLVGKPVVASDLPGVRIPTKLTGMGKVVQPGDPVKLAEAIVRLLSNDNGYRKLKPIAHKVFNYTTVINDFETIIP